MCQVEGIAHLGYKDKDVASQVSGTTVARCGASIITLITGVIAIFQANGVKTKFNSGDYAGANKKSASAKMWMLITVGLGIAASLYSAYMLISNPELLQQIQEGSGISNLYPFLK